MFFFTFSFTFLVSYLVFFKLSKKLEIDENLFNLFYFSKFLFLLIFIVLNTNNLMTTDSKSIFDDYYKFQLNNKLVGDNLLYGINYFFTKFLNLNYISINTLTIFPIILATLFLLHLIQKINFLKIRVLFYFLLLLPSFNFWTVGLSKDMLSFFALSYFLFNLFYQKRYSIIFSVFLIFIIRPYISFIIIISFILSYGIFFILNLNKQALIFRYKNLISIFIQAITILIILIILYYILSNYLGSFGFLFLKGKFLPIIGNLQSHYQNTPLGIPAETNIFLRYFYYLFYPFPWSNLNGNILMFIMTIENLLLMLLFFFVIVNNNLDNYKNFYFFFGIISFLTIFFLLALVTSNLGIAFRQKWLFLPYIFLLIVISKKKSP